MDLRAELSGVRDEAVRSRAELAAAAQRSEAEAQRLRGMAEDLERRLKEAEAPKPTAETVELRVAVVELKHTVATLLAEVARGADAAEEADQLKREMRALLHTDGELQAARAEVKRLGAAVSRLEAVEAEARELRGQRDTLTSDLARWTKAFQGQTAEAAAAGMTASAATALRKQLNEATAEADKMTKHRDLLEAEVARLEALVGRGDFDSSRTKVLHCSTPPLAHQRLETLEAEAAALKAQLAQRDRQQQRLLTEFQRQTTQYREGVYRLTGWKVHRTQDEGLYRLTSCFLPEQDKCFLFRPLRSGKDRSAGFAVAGVPAAASLAGLPPPPPDGDSGGVAIPTFLANALLRLQAHPRQ
eukprot:TRINITY_DN3531_c0_g1_i1.p1 TRINITY_DN3531_c0_g1~~TRINITY_DN3531_c0_g1_i1.p1  ORF type:complete len:366 (-),score=130.61 TRINITY_DN3531_c0_g1_i1:80-1156(-)